MSEPTSHRTVAARWCAALTCVVVLGALAVTAAEPAHAAGMPRYVATGGADTSSEEVNDCLKAAQPCATIQHAVDEANAGDTISVGTGQYDESVLVRESMTIVGTGAPAPVITGDDQGDTALFADGSDTNSEPSVSLESLTLSSPAADGLEVLDAGAQLSSVRLTGNGGDGLVADGGATVQVADSEMSNNTGSGIDAGVATVSVSHSRISGNGDGGVLVDDGAAGASVAIDGSTVDGNQGFGVGTEGPVAVSVSRSTISGSSSSPDSTGTVSGGIVVFGGSLVAHQVTVDGNAGVGVDLQPSTSPAGAATTSARRTGHAEAVGNAEVDNSTITRTTSVTGSTNGGLVAGAGVVLRVSGTIIAGNTTPDCTGHVTDAGYNLAGDGSCGLLATGSHAHAAAHLGQLGAHGGPTPTVIPGLRSRARNAIPFHKAGCLKGATDQRGEPRREPAHGRCDIGSVEVKVVNPKLRAKVSGHKHDGHFTGPVTVTYRCKRGTARLRHGCPKATHLRSPGLHHIKKTIHALDGGKATVRRRIRIA